MDAPENELDVKLHRVSGELIAAFDERLGPFLRKPDATGGHRVRSRVRTREAAYLISNLLDPFQELPQLLDPHLPKWLPMLAEAFLEYLQTRRRRAREASAANSLLMPLPTAVCKLIYSFCKIRGEKVIVRFLNVETKYLELLLAAMEDAERHQSSSSENASLHWTWEERYVVLLWLSHLMYAPFDLSTISSVYMEDIDLAGTPGFFWPSNVPGIAIRILPLAFKYLACPSKERDAAKALLVRMAMRKDMQQLGVLHALVQWALFWLRPNEEQSLQSPYKCIGVLSFLAGILRSSAETSDMDKYSSTIFYTVNAISSNDGEISKVITSSALAKKMIIKVIRSIAVSKLKGGARDLASIELIETTIGHLLESLADNDTPVRFAASKALSIVTLSLPDYMASEVVDAVLESLNRNVLWIENPAGTSLAPARDLTSIDPLEWHGLMLTLSHLLYRRSPPTEKLGSIIRALLLGLSFERRSPSGTSTGSNVRDAACFGIWALARRYSTQELLAVSSESIQTNKFGRATATVLQILATDLVVTASMDSAGNIRRGSSAALQELIGRHPDTVEKGIAVVQTVDYHAVALRSRAIHDVAVNATKLHLQYGDAILQALLGWRGTGDPDIAARRVAALSYGSINLERSHLLTSKNLNEVLLTPLTRVYLLIKALQTRQVEERHGLLLALAAVMDCTPSMLDGIKKTSMIMPFQLGYVVETALDMLKGILDSAQSTVFRKPDLIAEGICRLFISFFPFFQAEAIGYPKAVSGPTLVSGTDLTSTVTQAGFAKLLSKFKPSAIDNQERLASIIDAFTELENTWLTRTEPAVLSAASEASLILLTLCSPKKRIALVVTWSNSIRNRSSRSGVGAGCFQALTKAYPILALRGTPEAASKRICEPLLERWAQDTDIDVRVAILQSLTQGQVLLQNVDQLLGMISQGLEDYTTNARGDIGSHVRLQAIKATKYLWSSASGPVSSSENGANVKVSDLLPAIARLAAEKLDRVRVEAQTTLAFALKDEPSMHLKTLTFSSKAYFTFLLNILNTEPLRDSFADQVHDDHGKWMDEVLAGYVTSADTGNEDLVIASRAALVDYCHSASESLDLVCTSLLRNLKAHQGQDRIIVPTLEIVAFLFSVGIYQQSTRVDYKSLCLQVQKAGYKSGNVRKLEACVKVYAGVASISHDHEWLLHVMADDELDEKRTEGVVEARKRLGALAIHPWPRVRNSVIDTFWGLLSSAPGGDDDAGKIEKLKGVDWGTADKSEIKKLVDDLDLCSGLKQN